jgi:hypothetical protein
VGTGAGVDTALIAQAKAVSARRAVRDEGVAAAGADAVGALGWDDHRVKGGQ